MDSEDDMYDADDFDYMDDDRNSDGAAAVDDADEEVYDNSDSNPDQKSFTILKENDIRQRQEDEIARISAVLSVSRDSACSLLRRYNWNSERAEDDWFADEERVRKAVGLFEKSVVKSRKNRGLVCGICFELYSSDSIKTAACRHPFCADCWGSYISTSINGGPGCLMLKCPTPSCGAAVGGDMVNKLALSDDDRNKYRRYLFRSYVEDNYKKLKWCPAPECECAVEFDLGSKMTQMRNNYDVSCLCSHGFCWNCSEEAHRPVDCDTVAKWILKNSSESENTTWILANSKPCPKCKRPIEKNQGCMHMTCSEPCRFQFCWVCLKPWSDHGPNGYSCNRFDSAAEQQRKKAKENIIRYTHYYERWAANHSSRQKALADLDKMQTVHVQKLRDRYHGLPPSHLEFVTEAWKQIVECRRVLKWTYAYGYYLDPEKECAKKNLFEYLQGEAEAGLERLHQCAEKELNCYLTDNPPNDFLSFRTKLLGLTRVTCNYFENLVRALENGLSEMDPVGVASEHTSSDVADASTTKRRKQSQLID